MFATLRHMKTITATGVVMVLARPHPYCLERNTMLNSNLIRKTGSQDAHAAPAPAPATPSREDPARQPVQGLVQSRVLLPPSPPPPPVMSDDTLEAKLKAWQASVKRFAAEHNPTVATASPVLMYAGDVIFISGAAGPHAAAINGVYSFMPVWSFR